MPNAARVSAGRKTTKSRRPRPRPAATAQTDFYFPQPVDNSRLVKYADPRERAALQRLVWMSLVLMVILLGAAWQRFATIRAGYRIEELKTQKEQLIEANRQLRLEEATLRSPDRIDAIARNELGFQPPRPGQLVRLENGPTQADDAVVARAMKPNAAPPAP